MTQAPTPAPEKKTWSKPELMRLGKIADVAGNKKVVLDGGTSQPNPKS